MARLTPADARAILERLSLPVAANFHSLPSSAVDRLISEADAMRYRKPRNAPGSRARMFHAFLTRRASQRTLETEWRLYLDYGQGWELETTEATFGAIRERCKEYRENCPEYPRRITGPHRVPVAA